MQVTVHINNRILILILIVILALVGFWLFWQPGQPSPDSLSSVQQTFGMRLLSEAEDTNEYVRSQMDICYENGGENGCYKEVGDLLFGQLGYQAVLDSFHATETEPEIFSRCHEVTHYVGRLAYAETKSIPVLYDRDRSVCHGGFYHGVIEGYFGERKILVAAEPSVELAGAIKSVCGEPRDYQGPRFYSECVHGIGHAMMFITDQELPQSLGLCDELDSRSDQETCYGGALMENSSSSTNLDHPTKYLKAGESNYPCTILDERYLKQCYEYQSSYFAEISNWDWQKVVALCSAVPQAYQGGCFHIIGTNQVGFTQDPETWKRDCGYIPDLDYRGSCIAGVISSLGGRYVGQDDQMLSFCAGVESAMQEPCYRQVGNVVSTWSQNGDTRAGACAKVQAVEARTWCQEG